MIDATSRVPPASSATFAVASPWVMPVTVALILLRALRRMAAPILMLVVCRQRYAQPILPAFAGPLASGRPFARPPARWQARTHGSWSNDHEHDGHEHENGHPAHGEEGHVHDASCAVAHGDRAGPGQDKVLVAVFAPPVASYLLRYAADAGYRPVLVEPDPERAKTATADMAPSSPASLDGLRRDQPTSC